MRPLSGQITDLQSRLNVANLIDSTGISERLLIVWRCSTRFAHR
jgi:hypothetical protein